MLLQCSCHGQHWVIEPSASRGPRPLVPRAALPPAHEQAAHRGHFAPIRSPDPVQHSCDSQFCDCGGRVRRGCIMGAYMDCGGGETDSATRVLEHSRLGQLHCLRSFRLWNTAGTTISDFLDEQALACCGWNQTRAPRDDLKRNKYHVIISSSALAHAGNVGLLESSPF